MSQSSDGERVIRPRVKERKLIVSVLPMTDRVQLAKSLRRYLSDRSPYVKVAALDRVRDQTLLSLETEVRTLLSDKNPSVRRSAVECIGFLYADKGIEAHWLYPLLHDDYWLVRIETLETLPQIGDKSALPLIAKKLQDENPLVRAYAATAIEDLEGEEYVEDIVRAMKNEKDDRAKVGFSGALFYFGYSDQFLILLGFLSSTSHSTRCAAADTINSFELTFEQLQSALTAVSYALRNPIARGDVSTMERVLEQLLLQREAMGRRPN